jgi:hypothetical protein
MTVAESTVAVAPFATKLKSCTVSVIALEVLLVKSAVPAYTAVMLCNPTESELVVSVAFPVLSKVALPNGVVPLKKLTLPTGVTGAEETVVVNVTLLSDSTVAALVCSEMVVPSSPTVTLTVPVAAL